LSIIKKIQDNSWLYQLSLKFEDIKVDKYSKLPFVTMLLAVMAIYLPLLTGDLWLKWDMYENYFPLDVSISDSISQGTLPLWDPFIRRGTPIAYLAGMPVWHPIILFFGMFGFTFELMHIQFVFIILLAAIFMYLAVGNYVSNKWICSAAGVAYATCGLFISNSSHLTYIIAAMSFPLLHFAFTRWMRKRNLNNSILVSIAIASLLLNNYPTFLVMALVFIAIEFVFHLKDFRSQYDSAKKAVIDVLKFVLTVSITTLMLSIVALITNLEAVQNITRHTLDWEIATQHSLSVWHWLGALSPVWMEIGAPFNTADITMQNTYMAIPFLLCLFCAVPRKRYQWGFLVIALLAFFMTLGRNGYLYYFVYEFIPTMDAFRFPAGLRYYFFFYAILLGAINYESIKNNFVKQDKLVLISKIFVLINLVVFISFASMQYLVEEESRTLFPPNTFWELGITIVLICFFIWILQSEKRKFFSIAFLVTVIFFSYMNFGRNDLLVIGSENKPPVYEEELSFIYSNENYEVPNYFVHPMPDTVDRFAFGTFYKQFYTDGYIGGFELTKYREARDNHLIPNEGDPVIWIPNQTSHNLTAEGVVVADRQNKNMSAAPQTIKMSPNELNVNLNLPLEQFVIIEQNYFKGWRAFIDDRETEIIEATGGVMAVKAPAGEHTLKLIFKPTQTVISIYVTFISWGLLIVYGLTLFRKRNKKKTMQ